MAGLRAFGCLGGIDVYDVVIIGGGPGGYTAAIRGSQLGLRVCLVEKEDLGGTCLNRGCIPTKAWAASARTLEAVRKAEVYGITGVDSSTVRPDIQKITMRARSVTARLRNGIELLLRKRGVTVVKGQGFLGADGVRVNGSVLSASYYIAATGSLPKGLPILQSCSSDVYVAEDILSIDYIPKRLLVIGGGVIGAEFASLFNSFGSDVVIIDILPEILTALDKDVRRHISHSFKKRGIRFIGSTSVTGTSDTSIKLDNGGEILADAVLVAVGRHPETSAIDLGTLGIATDTKGFISTGDDMATSNPKVYAVGDVTGRMLLAHAAARQGLEAIGNIAALLGYDKGDTYKGINYDYIPSCIFTEPEIAAVGLSEDEAVLRGYKVMTGRFPYTASGKAAADAAADGFVKLVADRDTGVLLGFHIVGSGASDILGEGTLAIQHRITLKELSVTTHAHPTLSEMIAEAAEAVFGRAIHII